MNRLTKNTPNHISHVLQGRAEGHFPWSTKHPILSADAKRLVGNKISWLLNAIEKSAQIGRDGFATYDRGNAHWGNKVFFWELRAYDQHLLYRDFDYTEGFDETLVIIVITLAEAVANGRLRHAMMAAEMAQYYPPKPKPLDEPPAKGKSSMRSRRLADARSYAASQG